MKSGDNVRGYRLDRIVGRGGMGVVWLARRSSDDRAVVLKHIREASVTQPRAEELQRRLEREARILGQLEHEHIVGALEWFEASGEFYLVLEHVAGEPLSEWLQGEPAPTLSARLRVMRQVVAAVEYAHAQGVIHRDLKPSNVMIAAGPVAKVLDFGLARALDSTRLTRTGLVLGTLSYMAPEQARGQTVDERADVFSLGIMLARCLGLEAPFRGDKAMSRLGSLLSAAPVELEGWLPADIRSGLERAIAKEPAARMASAGELGSFLDELIRREETLEGVLDEARQQPAGSGGAGPKLGRFERPEAAAAVSDVLARHSSRRGSLVAVLGAPGAGRSTLLTEIGERLQAAGIAHESIRFISGATPNIVVQELLRQRGAGEAGSVASSLETAIAPLESMLEEFLTETEERARAHVHAILLDDIQFAAADELAWIGKLAAWTRELQLVLVLAGDHAREGAEPGNADAYGEFLTRLAARDDVIRVPLSPLSRGLVMDRLTSSGIPEGLAQEMVDQSGANPRVLSLLLERWHRGESLAEAPASGPLAYVRRLRSRFQLLDATSQAILRQLLHAGGQMHKQALLDAAGLGRLVAASRLRELESKHGWLRCEDEMVQLTQPYLAAIELDDG